VSHPLSATLGDAGAAPTLDAITRLAPFASSPVALEVDGSAVKPGADWVAALRRAKQHGTAEWTTAVEPERAFHRIDVLPRSSSVSFTAPDAFSTAADGIAMIERLPFEVGSFGSVWPDEWRELIDDPSSFGGIHGAHGWACAFRGAGHDRLVSRRWLAHGPWQLIRRADDLSVVQFHDLAADAMTAFAQAEPGHLLLGDTAESGYLPMPYEYSDDVQGLYSAETRTLEIVVPPGDRVDLVRMRDACAVRRDHRREPPKTKPIDQVAFVFLDEDDARRHLHDLWLRELECWAADDRPRRRLDLDYKPAPEPPAWAR
jgi:hypothetical protein